MCGAFINSMLEQLKDYAESQDKLFQSALIFIHKEHINVIFF